MKRIILLLVLCATVSGCGRRDNHVLDLTTLEGEWEDTHMEYTRLVDGEVIGSWSAGQDDFAHPSKLKFQKDGTGFVYQIYTDMKGMEDVWQTIGCFSWNHSGDKIVMTDFVMFFSPLESDVMLEPKQFPSEMEWAITTFSLGNLVVAYTLSNENDRKQVFEEHFVRTMKKVK